VIALFDIELEPLYYADLVAADRCRDCHRPIAGRHTQHMQGVRSGRFFVMCDECVNETST
jgi:hypothetical protein